MLRYYLLNKACLDGAWHHRHHTPPLRRSAILVVVDGFGTGLSCLFMRILLGALGSLASPSWRRCSLPRECRSRNVDGIPISPPFLFWSKRQQLDVLGNVWNGRGAVYDCCASVDPPSVIGTQTSGEQRATPSIMPSAANISLPSSNGAALGDLSCEVRFPLLQGGRHRDATLVLHGPRNKSRVARTTTPPPLSSMFSGTFKRKLRVAKVRSAWPQRVRPTIKACEQGGPNGRLIMRTEDDLSRFFLWRPFFVLTPTTVNSARSVFSHSSKRNMNDACRPQLVCCFSFQLFCLLEERGTGVSGSRPRQVSSVQEPRFSYLLLLSFCV